MPSLFVCIFYRQILVTFTSYLCLWYAYIGSHGIDKCTIKIQLEGILQRTYLKYKCHPSPLPQIICFNVIKIKFNNFLETKPHLYFEFLLFSLLQVCSRLQSCDLLLVMIFVLMGICELLAIVWEVLCRSANSWPFSYVAHLPWCMSFPGAFI